MQKDTLVIGGGQAGLTMSYYLTQAGRDHLVLEKRRLASAWRERWDSFTLVTPNFALRLPTMEYAGDDPDGFLSRDQVVGHLEQFAASFEAPVREGVEVTALEAAPTAGGLMARTSEGDYTARNVVVATGPFQDPRVPPFSRHIDGAVTQIHSSQYRNPRQLPPGAVLVVGSGQSGAQIAEELLEAGRVVYLSTGRAGRVPRRYRGRESARWMEDMGLTQRTADKLPTPSHRFQPNPHVSGKGGGRTLNLHRFVRQGMVLLGHLEGAEGTRLTFAPDLPDNLAAADKFASEFQEAVDKFILAQGIDAPAGDLAEERDGYDHPVLTHVDLEAEGVQTIIWATGYRVDFSWVKFPIFDEFGYPVHDRGVTAQPGLYFLGLLWLHTASSSLLAGVGDDAAHLAGHIARREPLAAEVR